MVTTVISGVQVLRVAGVALGVGFSEGPTISEEVIAGLLRRAACALSPCSPGTLIRAVMDGLEFIDNDFPTLRQRIEDVLEGLTMVGDLLELSQVTVDEDSVRSTWLFAAPPAFVKRRDKSVLILGMSRDLPLPLSDVYAKRVRSQRYARTITPASDEDLAHALSDLGYCELSESAWLRSPREQTYDRVLAQASDRLTSQERSGEVEDLQIIDSERPVTYYKGRWDRVRALSGSYVARRPQQYGAPIWGFALLDGGKLLKFLDFPFGSGRIRGCDQAWHLQMAIDRARHNPQVYRAAASENGVTFEFFSPIPLWCQRRFEAFGRPQLRPQCLFSYLVPEVFAAAEQEFLQKRLWMMPATNSD